jgi:hypothetical protein
MGVNGLRTINCIKCISRFHFFIYFLIKMYSVSVKCLIFTPIIDFCLFFGQSTGGKGLTIAKDNTKAN